MPIFTCSIRKAILPMNVLLALFILAAKAPAPTEGDRAEGVEVLHCDFEPETDKNFDDWPDGWTRRRGKGYPEYVKTRIVADGERPGSPGAGCLRIDLDGGMAA